MASEWVGRVLYREGVLRAPWRILFFFLFLFIISVPGQYVVSVLPRHPLEWGSRLATLLAAILAGSISLYQFDRRRPAALGFALHRSALREIASGFAIGLSLALALGALLFLSGALRLAGDAGSAEAWLWFLVWTLTYFALSAALEEALFRGYPFQVLTGAIGPVPAVILSAGTFAFLHAFNPGITPLALVNAFLAGVLLCIAYLRTRSLWFSTALHLAWNWVIASVLDLPISGLFFDAPMYTGVMRGDRLLTGGTFGPEASILATVVLGAGAVALARTGAIRESEGVLTSRPLADQRVD